jgi:hypothetical protein
LPLRRQHAGRFDPASLANNAGLIGEKLKRITSRIAEMRRIAIINITPSHRSTMTQEAEPFWKITPVKSRSRQLAEKRPIILLPSAPNRDVFIPRYGDFSSN